jgi:hypothetical protein
MYSASSRLVGDNYDSHREETFIPVENLGSPDNPATLVSSRDARGLHRPALDIDLPVTWVKRSDGSDHIWIDVKCSRRAYANLLQVLREFRLIDTNYVKPLDKAESALCYELDRYPAIDSAAITDYMKDRAGTFNGSFDQLLREAADPAVGHAPGAVSGPQMKHPVLLPLHVGAVVLDSTSNHHLYLDTILSWDGYARVLLALKRAKIIESKYFLLAIRRQATCLRPPWFTKGHMSKSVEEFLATRYPLAKNN